MVNQIPPGSMLRLAVVQTSPDLSRHVGFARNDRRSSRLWRTRQAFPPSQHDSRHTWKVYARKEGDVSTNTIEGYFSILKRGINGVYHHVGKQHLHRYLSEFDFRYNSRHMKDGERSLLAIRKVSGKRLKYRDSSGS